MGIYFILWVRMPSDIILLLILQVWPLGEFCAPWTDCHQCVGWVSFFKQILIFWRYKMLHLTLSISCPGPNVAKEPWFLFLEDGVGHQDL